MKRYAVLSNFYSFEGIEFVKAILNRTENQAYTTIGSFKLLLKEEKKVINESNKPVFWTVVTR